MSIPHYEIPDWDRNDYQLKGEKDEGGYTVRTVELPDLMPIDGFDEPITLDLYTVKPGAPTVLIHPILGGDNTVARAFAKFFVRWPKWNAVIQHRARPPFAYGSLEGVESGMVNIITNTLQAFDWLEYHDHIERERTISMGTSLGAISNALLTPYLPVRGFIHIMGGGRVGHILSYSEEGGVVEWRKQTLAELEIDRKTLYRRLRRIIKTDPMVMAENTGSMGVKMFIAMFDKSVPTEDQKRLRAAYPHTPDTSWVPSGHTSMALFLPYLFFECWRWARSQMK